MTYKGANKLGEFFTSRRERGKPGLPMLSVTMNNGVVTRQSLDRKMETNLSDEEHLLVRKNDIVYNMMRMWQGASGLADRDGLLSPAYVVLAPNKGIDPLYASYLFKSSRIIYLFWAYSYGLTGDRLRLYFNDFKSIPINIPSLPEQRKIGAILSTWDKACEVTEKLIEKSKLQKSALMQQLLTGKRRLPSFSCNWKEVYLSSIANITMGTSPNSDSYNEIGDGLPLIQGNADIKDRKSTPRIYTSEITKACKPGDILLSVRAPVGTVAISYHKACIGRGIAAISAKPNYSTKYIYQALLAFKPRWISVSQGSTFDAVNSHDVKKLNLLIPPSKEEQDAIIRILEAQDKITENLTYHLGTLVEQKKALMQQLLTGKCRVKVDES